MALAYREHVKGSGAELIPCMTLHVWGELCHVRRHCERKKLLIFLYPELAASSHPPAGSLRNTSYWITAFSFNTEPLGCWLENL